MRGAYKVETREALRQLVERLDRLHREAQAAGLDTLALLLKDAQDEAEHRLVEIESRLHMRRQK